MKVLLAVFTFVLCACTNSAQDCDSREVQNTFESALYGQLQDRLGDRQAGDIFQFFAFSFENIRTESHYKDIKKYTCTVDVTMTKGGKSAIMYTVQPAEGSGELSITFDPEIINMIQTYLPSFYATNFNKLEAAVSTYYARTNLLPATDENGFVDPEIFYSKELLVEENIVPFGIELYRCSSSGNTFKIVPEGGNICAFMDNIPLKYACIIEMIKDDDNYASGEGRTKSGSPKSNFRTCEEQGHIDYIFRVF